MTISILGCGWYGRALGKSLIEKGFTVNGSTTGRDKLSQIAAQDINPYVVRLSPGNETYNSGFFNCDVLIISITPKFRQSEAVFYLEKIERIINLLGASQIKKVIYISSTKVYGDNNKQVTEEDEPLPDEKEGEILLAAEHLFKNEKNFKTAIIRFAGLVGPGRHPGKFFAGKTNIPNGKAPVNLIHLDDCVGITEAVIERGAFGCLMNGVSPNHPAKTEFYTQATRQLNLPEPHFIEELKNWKIVNSDYLTRLLNYQFKVPVWDGVDFNH